MIYIVVFYFYTPINEKLSVWFKIGSAGAFASGIIAYTVYEDPELVEQRFGLVLTGLLYALIASPMVELKEVVACKKIIFTISRIQ